MHTRLFILALFGAMQSANVAASEALPLCTIHSPPHKVALLELFTSEGCDSCPPADQFFSQFGKTQPIREQRVLMLSLHVDYWNGLGWSDPFSSAIFSQRQRALAAAAGSNTIYTPEVFVAGKELRGGPNGWRSSLPERIAALNRQPAQAKIEIQLLPGKDVAVTVNAQSDIQKPGSKLYLALIENNLRSQVNAGENRGRLLQHDYVARNWFSTPLLAGPQAHAQIKQIFSLPQTAKRSNYALAAFVQDADGQVLQALSLPLDEANCMQ